VSEFFPPVVSSNTINSATSEIVYVFNDTMSEHEFSGDEFTLSFEGPSIDYELSYSSSFTSKATLKLKYSISPGIVGGSGEQLTVEFSDILAFQSSNGIPISTQYVHKYSFEVVEASAQAESAGSGASFMFLSSFLLSIGASLMTGQSMELMWSLANTLQIIYILGLLDLYFPPNLLAVISYMKYSNFDNPFTQYLSNLAIGSLNVVSTPISTSFESFGFESSNILTNSFDKVFFILLLLMLTLVTFLLSKWLKEKSNWFAKLIKKVDKSLRYESTCRFMTEMSMSLGVSAFLNLFYGQTDGVINVISIILSFLILMFLFILMIYYTVFPFIYFDKIKEYPDYFERHCFLFLDFKPANIKCIQYYSYFISRRIMIAAVIVGMKDTVRIQLVCLFLLFIWIAKYQVKYRPFKDKINNFLN